ncbi:DNA-directed RNA polymerases I, II, and III subunit RPABC4 [Wickerhamiella sorbophila]|uniref:DNA-directed RNA polymerases I, II, and III subunit RPABC4 n=1 Tax=Wickerhamiella sorbophila TaxID=45607 RepID=A0A2T0FFQ7_9ASCO|nr:DNA-directed RNA polymerases I, II, and III subunit RPABC4 [Wickerhamiella sorbophila]PRT53826.1 DNA-directed RNA polymerases I, II, and III subunit RPABC4 [Wickerhamiella sorbophila]
MNRDSFVPPTSMSGLSAAAAGSNVHKSYGVRYLCANCASNVSLSKECGHRVLYKERSRRIIQFEAR